MVKTGSLKVAWLADEGQIVEKGDTVVVFDQTDAVLTLKQSHNTLDTQDHLIEKQKMEARSRAETLKRDLESTELELDYTQDQIRKDEQIFSRWEIQESIVSAVLARYRKGHLNRKGEVQQDLSQAGMRLLQVDRKMAETEMKLARETLSSLEAKAPVGGVVLYQRSWTVLEVGSEVWPAQPLMEIADMDRFRGRLFVPENQIRGVQIGKKVQVRLDAFPGENFSGEIDKVDKIARQRHPRDPRKFFLCEARLDVLPDSLEKLNLGMRFSAEIELGGKKQRRRDSPERGHQEGFGFRGLRQGRRRIPGEKNRDRGQRLRLPRGRGRGCGDPDLPAPPPGGSAPPPSRLQLAHGGHAAAPFRPLLSACSSPSRSRSPFPTWCCTSSARR